MSLAHLVVPCPRCGKPAISIQDRSYDGDSLDACPHCLYLINPQAYSAMAEGRVAEWQYLVNLFGDGSLSTFRTQLLAIDLSDCSSKHCYCYPEDEAEAKALTKLGGMDLFFKRNMHSQEYRLYHPSVRNLVRDEIVRLKQAISKCGTVPNPAINFQGFVEYEHSLDLHIPF
ncbi:hypothetical protein REH81_00445 [Vibrio rotiferianus]